MPVGNKGPLSLEFDTLFMPIVDIPHTELHSEYDTE